MAHNFGYIRLRLGLTEQSVDSRKTDLVPPSALVNTDIAGSPSDLWGSTITKAKVEDVNFGGELTVSADLGGGEIMFIDAFRLKVYYTEATDFVVVSGTILGATESQVQAGGRTIILDLTGVTWLASGGPFDGSRQAIIDGIVSAQTETLGWNNEIRDNIGVGQVVRTSSTKVTITLLAAETGGYKIVADEVLTASMLASVHSGTTTLVDLSFTTITAECDQTLAPDSIVTQTNLTGSVTDIDESVDSPDANWLLVA